MFFASDNAGPAHPKVIEALAAANEGYASSYGDDAIMTKVRAEIRNLFEAPEAAVFLVATGTAANALTLATLCSPFDTIYCAREAHIQVDECNAPEFYTGGAKLTLVEGAAGKFTATALQAAIEAGLIRGVHGAQRGPVSITQVSDCGTVFSLDEIRGLGEIAHTYNLPLHMDGARFANALVALGCTPAEMTWKAGVDAVCFGGTKNGLLGAEAVIFFDPRHAWEFELRRKRGGHLFSKHRYLSAQMRAYLTDDLWLQMAEMSNAAGQRLADGLREIEGLSFMHSPDANMIFASFPRLMHQRLHEAGAVYEVIGTLEGDDPARQLGSRMVCDWTTTTENIDRFLEIAKG